MNNDEMLERDTCSWNIVVHGYVRCGAVRSTREVLDEMPDRGLVGWSSMIAGYAKNAKPSEPVKLFREIHCKGTRKRSARIGFCAIGGGGSIEGGEGKLQRGNGGGGGTKLQKAMSNLIDSIIPIRDCSFVCSVLTFAGAQRNIGVYLPNIFELFFMMSGSLATALEWDSELGFLTSWT
ncbi:hypothetical protein Scep_004962 [Stephania cephalantha]|uniref:Pentatricopeptide repeat-containing protein n=1 Tax=Stephania cephalantha TaxID=152367 RepID=A0AAP0KUT8_9MAGN